MRTHLVATAVASASIMAGGMLSPATGTAVASPTPPAAVAAVMAGPQPNTFLGDLVCQVLNDFFEKC